MVTYRFRLAMLRVRLLAPHPKSLFRRLFCLCLVMALVSVPVNAETYTAAGQKFVANGSTFSSIGGYSTSSMTFAGTGGLMLYNAFSNIDNQISAVKASAVTASSLSDAFSQYFGSGGIYNALLFSQLNTYFTPGHANNIHSLLSSVNTHTSQTVDNTSKISDRLMYNNTSAAGWLYALNQTLTSTNSKIDTTNDRIGSPVTMRIGLKKSSGTGDLSTSASVPDLLTALKAVNDLNYGLGTYTGQYVISNGLVNFGTATTPAILAQGLVGIKNKLFGDFGSESVNWLEPDEQGGLSAKGETYTNLFNLLAQTAQYIQNPLAKLQYVLADDDDIALKDAVKDNQQSVTDNFTGSGSGAVGTGDITDVADISGGIRDTYAGSGNIGDAFSVMGNSDSWLFFSSDVAGDLDRALEGGAQAASEEDDDPLSGFVLGDDGLYHLPSGSIFDVSSYLEAMK